MGNSGSGFGTNFPRGEEEYLRISAPATRCVGTVLPIGIVSQQIPAILARKTFIIQNYGDVWINFGGSVAVPNQCLFLGAGAMFGLDIVSGVPVSIVSHAGTVNVYILQIGV